MKILENKPLKDYTSLYVGGPARYFTEVRTMSELIQALKFAKKKTLPYFILGGGSNVLISDSGFNGLVIRVCLKGRKVVEETDSFVDIQVSAGENWDGFVEYAVNSNLYGIENMSHVPGTVGASVVQNIGCYGQEVSETVLSVEALSTETLKTVQFNNADMHFSYRKSRLNDVTKDKGKYVVLSVTFRLWKNGKIKMTYGDILKYFFDNKKLTPNLRTLRQAIIKLRDSKFPFPDKSTNGTAGSFWNADPINSEVYDEIIKKLKAKGFAFKANEMESKKNVFVVAQGFKVPYGVLVEVLGFKGKKFGKVRILETHSCVINNYSGEGSAQEVFELSNMVIDAVSNEFGVKMKVEPELVGDFS